MQFPARPWPTGLAEMPEPLVRRVLAGNPSAFSFTGTQTYLVGAGKDVAVIDPGPDEADHLAALIAAIGSARVTAILCTHTHRDHSPAAAPLAALTGAPVIGCAPLSIDDDGPRSDAAFDTTYAPAHVLADGEQIGGEGWTLSALATPGHTSNHLCFALEESGALFTGDHVMGWSTTVVSPPDGDMTAYLASLQLLQTREDRVYYPAHGPAVEKPRQLVRGMLGHRRQPREPDPAPPRRRHRRDRGDGAADVQGRRSAAVGRGRAIGAGPPHRSGSTRAGAARWRSLAQGGLMPLRGAALPWLLCLAALALAAWAWWPRASGDVLGSAMVSFERQNRLMVFTARLSPVVSADSESLLGMLRVKQVAVIPARVDYTVDLSAVTRDRLTWDEKARRLDVRLPAPMPGKPNLDEAHAQYSARGRVDHPHHAGPAHPRKHCRR